MTEQTKRRKKSWSESVGQRGHTIRLYEDINSGILYAEMRDVANPKKYRSVSLRHRDKTRAREWGHEQVAKWMQGTDILRVNPPTASRVMALYTQHQTPLKVESERDADDRRSKMWTLFLGATKDLSKLTLREWQSFTDARRTGAIDGTGKVIAPEERKPVRDGTVEADLVFLISVLNWASKWRLEDARYLMSENPARGFPRVSEKNPRRPVVTEERFRKIRAAAERVNMVEGRGKKRRVLRSYLPEILDLANGTGRRISAILALQYSDLRLADNERFGSIHWRAETDKTKHESTVPISADVRAAIDRILMDRPGIGPAFIFPAVNDRAKPIRIEVAGEWLRKAEAMAGLEKQVGTLWHAFRRKWACDRKGYPIADVAQAAGWRDKNTLLNIYQQADDDTMFRVVSAPTRIVERSAGA